MFGSKMNLNELTSRMFYSAKGQLIISAFFGLALAMMFQKVCKDRKCIVITAPATADIANKIFEFEGDCFKYTPQGVKCPITGEVIKSV